MLGNSEGGVTKVVEPSGYAVVASPAMLIVSAAVADDFGCIGLLSQLINVRVSMRWIYAGIVSAAICLTWQPMSR